MTWLIGDYKALNTFVWRMCYTDSDRSTPETGLCTGFTEHTSDNCCDLGGLLVRQSLTK